MPSSALKNTSKPGYRRRVSRFQKRTTSKSFWLCAVGLSHFALAKSAEVLNKFAVAFRYPGETATKIQAKDAVARCKDIRSFAHQSLGLKV
jgi:hypothetical protein